MREPFMFAQTSADPTTFDLQFIAGGQLYRYGLSLDDHHIREEWLAKIDDGSERLVYERVTDADGTVGINAGKSEHFEKFSGCLRTARPDRTFLETVRNSADIPCLRDVLVWFDSLWNIEPERRFGKELLQVFDTFRPFAELVLKEASTGVDGIDVTNGLKPGGLTKLAPERVVQTLHNHIRLPLEEESDGTLRLLDLAAVLYLMEGIEPLTSTCFVDEIERSLHPMLVRKFLESFFRLPSNRCQLIATTHDSNLLDTDLFRRDEIWFVEKDAQGSSHLYSLSDFPVRNSPIKKHYLEGRFGAIPFLGGMERLMPKEPTLK